MNLRRFLRDLCLVLGTASAAIWAGTRWVATPCLVEGASMEPTLLDGDRVIVDLWSLRERPPRPGDVMLLRGADGQDLVKRVARDPAPGTDRYPPGTFPRASVLEPAYPVLGDNPSASQDSRQFGPVPLHRFRGRVVFRYWPPSRAGAIE